MSANRKGLFLFLFLFFLLFLLFLVLLLLLLVVGCWLLVVVAWCKKLTETTNLPSAGRSSSRPVTARSTGSNLSWPRRIDAAPWDGGFGGIDATNFQLGQFLNWS